MTVLTYNFTIQFPLLFFLSLTQYLPCGELVLVVSLSRFGDMFEQQVHTHNKYIFLRVLFQHCFLGLCDVTLGNGHTVDLVRAHGCEVRI